MKPAIPDLLPLKAIDWLRFIEWISQANYELARYEGMLKALVNPDVLLSPLTTKEAVLSSKIEGTQATLQEVLTFEAAPDPDSSKYEDITEILNYRKAIGKAVAELKSRPLNLNGIKNMHRILLNSVRGQDKLRGEFRQSQNWIGRPGSTIEKAYYIPPAPEELMNGMSNLEKYLHFSERDRIIQLAVIHAQFEIIHPFMDGNGRIGRILIPLFLYEKKLLSSPVFYMSEYLETHRDEYYYCLREITEKGKWNEWIEFFLKGFIIQAKSNTKKAESILSLYESMKRDIYKIKSTFALPMLDSLFRMPIFSSSQFFSYSGIPKASGNRLLKELIKRELVTVVKTGSGRSPGVYAFQKLLKITERGLNS